jgi:hypothetical protein
MPKINARIVEILCFAFHRQSLVGTKHKRCVGLMCPRDTVFYPQTATRFLSRICGCLCRFGSIHVDTGLIACVRVVRFTET